MRNLPVTTVAVLTVLSVAADAMPHGRPGLWTITTSMTMTNMPQMPPEALAMMKSRGIKLPGMGSPIVNQICMTPQDVADGVAAAQRMREQHDVKCTPRILSETANAVSTEVTCHGMMEGVGHSQISWRGDSHYEGSYSFKGVMEGHPTENSSHFVGDFVKPDCGAVRPMSAMSHGMPPR